jgi:hypothetical protein
MTDQEELSYWKLRAKRLSSEIERLRTALEAVKAWQDSYPHATSGLTSIIEHGLDPRGACNESGSH